MVQVLSKGFPSHILAELCMNSWYQLFVLLQSLVKYGQMREKENKINENSIIEMTSCLENIKNLL